MTTQELLNAKKAYFTSKQGRDVLIKILNSSKINQFITNYMSQISISNISTVNEDIILQQSFLLEVSKTEHSNNLMVYLNDIERLDAYINDGQSVLRSIDWNKKRITPTNEGLQVFKLYCDLETNRPVLIGKDNLAEFKEYTHVIELPGYTPIREEYHYNSTCLEKITKGAAEIMYDKLQLYYYRQLLTNSKQEEVVERLLKKETLENVCLDK